jgi:hypothetical protein
MDDSYGIQIPGPHDDSVQRPPPRYLVVIDTPGEVVAELYLENRERVGEVSASAEDILSMIEGLVPSKSATGPEWDAALAGYSAEARAAADVYELAHQPKTRS